MKYPRSEAEAIRMSIEHWHENLDMLILNNLTKSDSEITDDIYIKASHCALCKFNEDYCNDCPLNDGSISNCCAEWHSVETWYQNWLTQSYAEGYRVITRMLNRLYKIQKKYVLDLKPLSKA